MRIIAGMFRSRTLAAPAGMATRPTSDRLRETLFNVLAPRIAGAAFLDLYAGSGAVGLEAISRGAASVTFVERAPAALSALKANLTRLGVPKGFHIQPGSVAAFLRKGTQGAAAPGAGFDLVFLDPPYDETREYSATLGMLGSAVVSLLSPTALIIAEHRKKDHLDERYGALERIRLLEQGDAGLSFYTAGVTIASDRKA